MCGEVTKAFDQPAEPETAKKAAEEQRQKEAAAAAAEEAAQHPPAKKGKGPAGTPCAQTPSSVTNRLSRKTPTNSTIVLTALPDKQGGHAALADKQGDHMDTREPPPEPEASQAGSSTDPPPGGPQQSS